MSELFFKALLQHPLKRVELRALRAAWLETYPEQIQTHDRDRLMLEAMKHGQELGLIRLPAARSFERFGVPPMPLFVTLVREAKPQSLMDYSQVAWAPEMGFWPKLSTPELGVALKINEWIIKRRGRFMQVPLRERSLEIFGNEKFLDSRVRGSALFGGRLPLEIIGARRVEHPLAYRPADIEGKSVLLVENHHTFWSLGEWNESAQIYSAIVYGNGKTIEASGLALMEVMRERRSPCAEYFGDLDPEGIDIPLRFNQRNTQQLVPCTNLYEKLFSIARHQEGVVATEPQKANLAKWLPSMSNKIIELWDNNIWLAQEGLGLEQLFDYKI